PNPLPVFGIISFATRLFSLLVGFCGGGWRGRTALALPPQIHDSHPRSLPTSSREKKTTTAPNSGGQPSCWTPDLLTRYISTSAVPFQSNFSMTEVEAGSRARSAALADLVVRPSNLTGRRICFAALVVVTMVAVMWLSAVALSADGL